MATLEPDLFWETMLGALTMMAGDSDQGRHAKFDSQTAPHAKGPRATEETARLALLLSAFGILAPQHTEAWTRRDGRWLQWSQLVRNGPTIQLTKLTSRLEESLKTFGDTTLKEREVVMRIWLVWQCRLRLPNSSLNVSFQEIMGLGAEARRRIPTAILDIIFDCFVPESIVRGLKELTTRPLAATEDDSIAAGQKRPGTIGSQGPESSPALEVGPQSVEPQRKLRNMAGQV